MSKILIAPKCQYGYNTDYFQMANRLAEKGTEVEVVCFDQGFRKMEAPQNVNVTYIERTGNKAANYTRHLRAIALHILKNRKDLNWIVISATIELCGILPFLLRLLTANIQWIMDVRTCSVVPSRRKRKIYDSLMLFSSGFFDHVTIISPLVADRLKIKKYEVLPLGSDCYVDLAAKKFNGKSVNFLYVGTFDNRRIEDLIQAFDLLSGKLKSDMELKFDVVGFSDNEETTERIKVAIQKAESGKDIHFHGRKSHQEIYGLFQEATVGFSYVPITEFFDVQPPTKTFEYMMNGIVCIGTNTRANTAIINDKNGVAVEDNVASLLDGIDRKSVV